MKRFGIKSKSKKGAASFYVVAFSTLILVIIAASFAAIIISEITRTSNDDLSQSAYDSALAGVEDAKLAFYNYQNCLAQGATAATELNNNGDLECSEIVYLMEKDYDDCDMVARILKRFGSDSDNPNYEGNEVLVQESNTGNNMSQAYTCVKIKNVLNDYKSTISNTNPSKIVKVKLNDKSATSIKTVEISWYSDIGNTALKYNNFNKNVTPNKVVFQPITAGVAVPPTISITMIQTAESFSLSDFDMTRGNQTDRATVYLVPTDNVTSASSDTDNNYNGAYRTKPGGDGVMRNYIFASDLTKSNDKTSTNLPFAVYCGADLGNDYLCTTTLVLPEAVNGGRKDDTFLFVVSLPYGKPSTDFAMKFCDDSNGCTTQTITMEGETETTSHTVDLKGVQVAIDSTGRANDLFRRVESRFEAGDTSFPYPLYALQLLGSDSQNSLLKKDHKVICEWNFPVRGC